MSATATTTTLPQPTAVDAPDLAVLPRPETPESLAQLLGVARSWTWPDQDDFVPLVMGAQTARNWPAAMHGISLHDSAGNILKTPYWPDMDAPEYHAALVRYVLVCLGTAAITMAVDETPNDYDWDVVADVGLLSTLCGGYTMHLASADAVRSVDRADLWRWSAARNTPTTGPASEKTRNEAMAAALPGALVVAQYARDVVQLHMPLAKQPTPPTPKRKGLSWH